DNVKRVTLRDISELVGFSTNTVSHALNKREDVREGMRAKILSAAHKPSYRSNR
ncbi:MAG TPA: LacI family transcriptional regulator, partial [Candidatus Acetothermia bacterium]|nr:LacI family transcriptional regulator [Candidatus Acetothermia bacterium]HEX32085.1 LacI family transcriptional regulator [Candidatus Acetothermia bacterium]